MVIKPLHLAANRGARSTFFNLCLPNIRETDTIFDGTQLSPRHQGTPLQISRPRSVPLCKPDRRAIPRIYLPRFQLTITKCFLRPPNVRVSYSVCGDPTQIQVGNPLISAVEDVERLDI